MLRTGRDQPQVPHSPTNWALPKAIRADARTAVVQRVGGNALPTERSQEVAPLIANAAVAHGAPLLGFQPKHMRNPFGVFIAFQIRSLKTGDLCDGKRAGIAVLVRDAT